MKGLLFLLQEDRGDLSERTETGTELQLDLNLEKSEDFLPLEVCFCSQLHFYSIHLLHWERAVWKNLKPSLQFYPEEHRLGRDGSSQLVTHC